MILTLYYICLHDKALPKRWYNFGVIIIVFLVRCFIIGDSPPELGQTQRPCFIEVFITLTMVVSFI